MAKLLITLFLITFLSLTQARLEFVTEIFRHGSRAPEGETFGTSWPNGEGMLTPSGFRQHYLIGAEMRRRYFIGYPNQHQLIEPAFHPDEIYARSTQVFRTVQSAYAQILGMFPVGVGAILPENLVDVALPNIHINGLESIQDLLGPDAIEGSMQPVGVRNFGRYTDSILGWGDCLYLTHDLDNRKNDPEVWKYNDDYFRSIIFDQLGQAFEVNPDEITFQDSYKYFDVLLAEEFEGIQTRFDFTETEWEIVQNMQVTRMIDELGPLASEIVAVRHIYPILELMKMRMGRDYDKEMIADFGNPKMVLLSTHDFQVTHIMHRLNPTNFELKHVDFASNIIFELHRHDTSGCATSESETCFDVKVFYNDIQLQFSGCDELDCTFREFRQYIESWDINPDLMQQVCHSEDPHDDEWYKNFDKQHPY